MAIALAQAGADVTIMARDAATLSAAKAALLSQGLACTTVQLDITDSVALNAYIATAPVFDVLINNAGATRNSPLVDMDEAFYDMVMSLNVRAMFMLTKAWLKRVQAAKDGRPRSVINVSSQMGHVGGPKRALYCASKHAMEGFTKALAWEVAKDHVRVNTICPTFIETELTKPYLADPEFRTFVTSRIARGTLGQLHEIMGPVIFLASDASSLMTGSALMLDGGWTAQ